MSGIRRGSQSPESRTSNPPTVEEDSEVQQFRSFIQESKSLGNTPEASVASSGEVVSESFIDALSEEEIKAIRKKVYRYWEKSIEEGEKPEIEVAESKMDVHQGSDPKIQDEEAVPSFEDVKSDKDSTTDSHREIGDLIESELRSIRHSKLSEGESKETTESGKMRRSEAMNFKDILKSADLQASTEQTSTQRRPLPVLRRTDVLEIVLRIYEYASLELEESLQSEEAKGSGDVKPSPEMSKSQQFRKRLLVEMRILYSRLHAYKGIVDSILEENENSSSSFQTKDSFSSTTAYPNETTGTVGPRSGTSSSLSVRTVHSDDTLFNVPSLHTESDSGTRSSVGNLQDVVDPNSQQMIPPQVVVQPVADQDPSDSSSENRGAVGPGYLAVPQVPGLSSSSTENARAESVDKDRRQREDEDEGDENAPKRQAT